MAQQIISSVENNFTKGLVTEYTGLNFPENAATNCDNCEFTLVGDVIRRQGIDFEENGSTDDYLPIVGKAVSTYQWKNPGGDVTARILVKQVGGALYFYFMQNATLTNPISKTRSSQIVNFSQYAVITLDETIECTYADGNGYLFVFHENCDPIYLTYSAGTITSNSITVKIRDFVGVDESSIAVNTRPASLTTNHTYNLVNQGWVAGNPWSAQNSSNNPNVALGSQTFTVASGISGIVNGQLVNILTVNASTPGGTYIPAGTVVMGGTVTGYTGTALTINVSSIYNFVAGSPLGPYNIVPANTGYINTWFSAEGNYPSNADVWWYFKNASGVFDPVTTANNTTLNTGNAPKGHYLLNAFNQNRSTISGVAGITDITTTKRPKLGAWFQGRIWYTGVNANQQATGNALFTTWSTNIYFSQIVQSPRDFGSCYQTNDPTSEQLFDILPTDGGVISIPEAGSIFKLFPVANGLLVFAANGVWFITGSQGIGFSANDYTITNISNIHNISYYSYVNVMGMPLFWNEEGIYQVTPGQGGQLTVENITIGTIATFYDSMPTQSKFYARGAYDPNDYHVQWLFKKTAETGIADRYNFDGILNYNIYNKAFFPYTVNSGANAESINSIDYITYPVVVASTPDSGFKYACRSSTGITGINGFADEHGTDYMDWSSVDFSSFFVTGYKLHGKGQFKFQVPYTFLFHRADGTHYGYFIQGLWDYAQDANSNRWSTSERADINDQHFGIIAKRHRIRGRGLVMQIKISSRTGLPFDIMGWSINETLNSGV